MTERAQHDVTLNLRGALAPVVSTNHAAITEPAKIGELLRSIEGYKGQAVTWCALRIAPLVFVRPGELRHAEWSEFDLDGDEPQWRIPAKKMKMREQHIVPLSKQVVTVLPGTSKNDAGVGGLPRWFARRRECRPNSSCELIIFSEEPFRFTRTPRNEHGAKGTRSSRHDDLVCYPLVGSERRFGGEEIGRDAAVLGCGAGSGLRIRPVEDAEREHPQHGPRQRDHDAIAPALDGSPPQRREDAHGAEPADHIVADRNDRRLLRAGGRPFESEQARYGCADLIEAGTVRPGAFLAMTNDTRVDQPGLLRTQRLGIKVVASQESWVLIGKEYVGIP